MQASDTAQRVRVSSVGSIATIAATILSVLTFVYLLAMPVYSGVSTSRDTAGAFSMTTVRSSLIEVNGWDALIPIFVPVAICIGAAVVWSPRRARIARVGAAILLYAFVVVTGFSIGLLYLPSVLAMTIAALARA